MNLKEEIKTLDLHAQIGDLKGVDKENNKVFNNVFFKLFLNPNTSNWKFSNGYISN